MRLIQAISKGFNELEQEVKHYFFATVFLFILGFGFYTWCYFLVMLGGK